MDQALTQRQFLQFIGSRRGKRSHVFARKILNYGHAAVRDYMGWGPIYHLISRTLYTAIGKNNLRNRREHSFEFIRTRLVLLDFLLSHPEHDYFETAEEKVRYFCENLGLSPEYLPAKIYEAGPDSPPVLRHFVDGFPLFVAPHLPDLPPVVTFSYVDSGASAGSPFRRHLATYQLLFRQLTSFRFLYISPKLSGFSAAEEHVVTARREATATYRLEDFRLREEDQSERRERHISGAKHLRTFDGEITQSERDWAFAKRALARGDDPEEVIRRIADYRADDKHDPEYYARHTVMKAQAELRRTTEVREPSLTSDATTGQTQEL